MITFSRYIYVSTSQSSSSRKTNQRLLLIFSQQLTCSRKSHVCRSIRVLFLAVSRAARSHWSAAIPRLDTRGQRSGGQREDGGGDAEAATEFSAHLPRPGKRHYHDPSVSPDDQRHRPTHRPHTGTTGMNTQLILTSDILNEEKLVFSPFLKLFDSHLSYNAFLILNIIYIFIKCF